MPKEIYKLTNIHMEGNEHGQLRKDIIYAELRSPDGSLAISATLEYILAKIRDRNLTVAGVSVDWKDARGAKCSKVSLNKY